MLAIVYLIDYSIEVSKQRAKQMTKIKMIGTINGYVNSVFKMGRKKLSFDGTTKGLVEVAIANGAKDGQKLLCNYGGASYDNCDMTMIIETSQFDGSNWANRKW